VITFHERNNFCYCHLVLLSTDFKLKFRFIFKFESIKGWTLRDIALTIINSPLLKFGQIVHHTYLQTLLFDLSDMHKPSLNIEEILKRTKCEYLPTAQFSGPCFLSPRDVCPGKTVEFHRRVLDLPNEALI
jgi:hypothetical protein